MPWVTWITICLVLAIAPRSALAQEAPEPNADTREALPREAADVPASEPEPAPATQSPDAEPPSESVDEVPPPPLPVRKRFEGEVSREGGDDGADEEPYAAESDSDAEPSHIPGFSIRVDPFNWLLEGRLGFELEVVAWKFISVELVPVFVANATPPAFNFSGRDDPLSQHSHGIGPLAGASLGAGFWLSGTPLRGYVLRAVLTNYGYTYEARDRAGVFDHVDFTERRFYVYIGSHARFGPFTIAGGIGLGYELNQQQRCIVNGPGSSPIAAVSGCPDSGEQHIMLDRDGHRVANLNGGLHPFYLAGRLSLGVSFD